MQRRPVSGLWTLLSGILEPGEEPAAGLVREVAEETGVQVEVEQLVAVTVSPQVRHSNGHLAQYLELTFVCRPVVPGQVPRVADDESVDVGWFTLNALPPMSDRMRNLIARAEKDEPQAWFTPASAAAV